MKKIGLVKHPGARNTKGETALRTPLVPADFTHCAIVGETGCGKTTSAILPNIEERIKKGHGVLIYDYKGNLHPKIKALALRQEKLEKVVIVGQPWGRRINVVEGMSSKEIEEMLNRVISMKKEEDAFWRQSALGVLVPVLRLFTLVEALKASFAKHEIDCDFELEVRKGGSRATVRYDMPPTFRSLEKALASLESMKLFTAGYGDLHERLKELYRSHLFEYMDDLIFQKRYKELMEHLEYLEEIHDKYTSMPLDRYSTYTSVHLTIAAALNVMARSAAFNAPDLDIVRSLEEGGIVVIDTREIPDTVLAHFTATLFERMKVRFVKESVTPISVFLDEAQKILLPETEIPVDTLREAKVEVFMAFQNDALIRKKIGDDAYASLHTNLTKKIVYRSDTSFGGLDTSGLGTFEYLDKSDGYRTVSRAEPLFFEDAELFEAELAYQRMAHVQERYMLEREPEEPFVCIYDAHAFEQGRMLVRTRSRRSEYIDFVTRKEADAIEKFMLKMRKETMEAA